MQLSSYRLKYGLTFSISFDISPSSVAIGCEKVFSEDLDLILNLEAGSVLGFNSELDFDSEPEAGSEPGFELESDPALA